MEYIVKIQDISKTISSEQFYELFITETITDINNNIVTVPKSVGKYYISQLDRDKAELLKKIDEINDKLLSIENFKLFTK